MTNALELSQANLGYEGKTTVADLNIQVPKGSILTLVGGNGSGKSTFLKTIAGLLPPVGGTVKVLGSAPGKQPLRISYHGQFHPNSFLLPLRAIDVVRMARFPARGLFGKITSADEDIIYHALAELDAVDLANKPINALSGGQKQRVFLAHTLARQADLVLLDEPTAGLDVPGSELYDTMVRNLKTQGRTLVIATHSIKEASSSDYVLLLASRVVAFGQPKTVLSPANLLETFGLVAQVAGDDLLIVDPHHGHDHPHEHS